MDRLKTCPTVGDYIPITARLQKRSRLRQNAAVSRSSTESLMSTRRTVRYSTLSEAVQDAEHLVGNHRTVEKWSFGQICQHLAKSMNASIDGFGFQAPWWVRWLIAPVIKNSILLKPMKPGFKLPKKGASLLPDDSVTADEGLSHFKAGVERLSHEVPTAAHPVFGKMASEEVIQLHLRHCELHMSFIIPGENGQPPA